MAGLTEDGSGDTPRPSIDAPAQVAEAGQPADATGDAAAADAAPTDAAADAASPDAAPRDAAPPLLMLSQVSPNNGLADRVLLGAVVSGQGFSATTQIRFGGAVATCAVRSASELSCNVPASQNGAGAVDVVASDAAGASARLAAGYTFTAVTTDVTWCDLQWPTATSAAAAATTEPIFGQIYQAGATDRQSTPVAGIHGELGFGPVGSDPRTSNDWRFSAAAPNPSYDFARNNDEFLGHLMVTQPGAYAYGYRFSLDGGVHYSYCGTGGGSATFNPAQLGALQIMP
jgi:hypothetical protein